MKATFLTPAAPWATTAKTYSAPNRDSKKSDYNLGTYFTFETVEFSTLEELALEIRSRPDSILIYGNPTERAIMIGRAERRTLNFPYPDDQQWHIFDIDAWKVPTATRELIKPDLHDPESMGRLINAMLRNEGFEILADADKIVVLTSSSWDLNLLNCHIRVLFDQPIRIEALRQFSIALAKVNQRKVFDDAIYKSVQPQFITPPTCTGFADPYKGKRIFLVPGSTRMISLDDFTQKVHATLKQADWNPFDSKSDLPPIGVDWLHTIRNFVGDERGINEPCHRAAAQLVQSSGKSHVLANINDFAQQMFDEVWKTITQGDSERGHAKDKSTYTLARFRQYLDSACQKTFGDKVDNLVDQVQEAIEAAKDGNIEKLYDTPVAHALKELKCNHLARFATLKRAITKTHKILGVNELNAIIKSAPAPEVAEGTMIVAGGDGWNENDLIDPVLKQYDYVQDYNGTKFAAVPGNGDGGYHMIQANSTLIHVFYHGGMKLSGNQVASNFGSKAFAMLMGEESGSTRSKFQRHMIATRVISESQTLDSPTWINLGLQPDGQYRSAKISAEGVTMMSHKDSKPRWISDQQPLEIATNEDLEKKFTGYDSLIEYTMETLPKFIPAANYDLMKVLMWLCATFSDKQLAYIAELVGPTGVGKSTSAEFLKDLVDPSGAELGTGADRTNFRGINDDFINDIERRHVTVIDNVSELNTNEQNTLCAISTGLKQSDRILYTHSYMDRTVRRPLVFTALTPVITRSDLKSRVVTIELKKPVFNPRLLDDWYTNKPYLSAAIMQITAKALGLYSKAMDKPEDIHPRDMFLASVNSAIKNYAEIDYEYVREFRMAEAWEASRESIVIAMLIRYLQEKYPDQETLKITTRGLLTKLKDWCLDNAGKVIDDITIDPNNLPNNGRRLGNEIIRSIDIIEKVAGWKLVDTIPKNNGKQYVFNRKKPLDRISNMI